MTFYLAGVGAYCVFLLFEMFSDRECSKTDRASWMLILLASLLWVIVIPISIVNIAINRDFHDFEQESDVLNNILQDRIHR